MFRLKKLEIQGFKSFVDRTSLTLPSRLTAITSAPLETRYLIISLSPRAAA